MSENPWNEEVYAPESRTRRNRSRGRDINTLIFTILGIIFLLMVIAITVVAVWMSNGGSKTNSNEGFYNSTNASSIDAKGKSSSSKKSSSKESSSSAASTSSTASSSSTTTTSSVEGETITVNAGEGEASIAARAGISIAQLEQLNPDHMTTGSWYADPGDIIKIK